EIPPEQPRLCSCHSGAWIDPHARHGRKIDDDPAVADGRARDVVAASSDRDDELVLARESDCSPDIGDAGTARDEGRPAVDRAIPDAPVGVVGGVAGTDERPPEMP